MTLKLLNTNVAFNGLQTPTNMPSNPVLHPGDEVSSLRFCHCCANETVNCYSLLLLPVEEQISYLREIKTPLILACQKITSHLQRVSNN